MNNVFVETYWMFALFVYLDDILVYSKNDWRYEQHLRQVLQCLKYNQFLCKIFEMYVFRIRSSISNILWMEMICDQISQLVQAALWIFSNPGSSKNLIHFKDS